MELFPPPDGRLLLLLLLLPCLQSFEESETEVSNEVVFDDGDVDDDEDLSLSSGAGMFECLSEDGRLQGVRWKCLARHSMSPLSRIVGSVNAAGAVPHGAGEVGVLLLLLC